MRGGFPEWQDTDLLREEFGDGVTKNGWLEAYREFLCFASDYKVEGEVIPPAGQESLQDDRMDNHGSRERFSEIVNRISARRGVPVEEVLGGDRRYDAVDFRREILKTCKDNLGVSISQLAPWLGMKENTASYLLKTEQRVPR